MTVVMLLLSVAAAGATLILFDCRGLSQGALHRTPAWEVASAERLTWPA